MGTLWDKVKSEMNMRKSGGKEEDDDLELDDEDEDEEDEDEDKDYKDADPVVKSLLDKLNESFETAKELGKSVAALIERTEKIEVMQKAMADGFISLEKSLATPNPRKSAVSALDTSVLLAKAMAGGAASGGVVASNMKPFTKASMDVMGDILIKSVEAGEIDHRTLSRYDSEMNKSLSDASYVFSDDFVNFVRKHVA